VLGWMPNFSDISSILDAMYMMVFLVVWSRMWLLKWPM